MDGNIRIIQFLSIVPIAFFIWSILLLLSIFRTKPLDQAFTVSKYKDLLTKNFKEILLYEIEANARSYTRNVIITEKGSKRYATAIKLVTIALIISIILMMANKFITIEKEPRKTKVGISFKIYNSRQKTMSELSIEKMKILYTVKTKLYEKL
ncbi:MAG: hypothetical protein ABI675_31160 [Chitinophagaceae bacterium]